MQAAQLATAFPQAFEALTLAIQQADMFNDLQAQVAAIVAVTQLIISLAQSKPYESKLFIGAL